MRQRHAPTPAHRGVGVTNVATWRCGLLAMIEGGSARIAPLQPLPADRLPSYPFHVKWIRIDENTSVPAAFESCVEACFDYAAPMEAMCSECRAAMISCALAGARVGCGAH